MVETHPWYSKLKFPTNDLHYINEKLTQFQILYQPISKTIYQVHSKTDIKQKLDQWYNHIKLAIHIKKTILENNGQQIYSNIALPAPSPVTHGEYEKNKIEISLQLLKLNQVEYLISLINDIINQIKSDIRYLELKFRDIENKEYTHQTLLDNIQSIRLNEDGLKQSEQSLKYAEEGNKTSTSQLLINVITNSVTIGYLIVGLLLVNIL